MKALILAGGFGTRLAHVVKDLPKPMAPVGGRPFLEYLVQTLVAQGIRDMVLLTGYKTETIEGHFEDGSAFGAGISYSRETEPLGTGGAVRKAMLEQAPGEEVLVLNGDTYFALNYDRLVEQRRLAGAPAALALQFRRELGRYGSVVLDDDGLIAGFVEKRAVSAADGYINGGVYALAPSILERMPDRPAFSLEKDVFERAECAMAGLAFPGPFIDIGVPEDYFLADRELPGWMRRTLRPAAFIDRDGVVIEDRGYPYHAEDLAFVPGAADFIKAVRQRGYAPYIVTNQAGIAKGIFSLEQYRSFERLVEAGLEGLGAQVEGTAYCPFHPDGSLSEYGRPSLLRKPEPGMILELADRDGLDLERSFMVGDKQSDLIRLPYLKSFLLRGRYPLPDDAPAHASFHAILEEIDRWKK